MPGREMALLLRRRIVLLQHVLEHLLEFLHLWADDEVAIGLRTMFVVIILVVVFGGIEFAGLCDLRHDRRGIGAFLVELCLIVFRLLPLFFVMVEDRAAVLGADIVALAVQLGGIM